MKALGVLLVVLAVLSFLVPVPRRERRGISIGDASFSIRTERREKLPPAVGVILAAGGVVALLMGARH
jgi:hypothetical protein